MSNITDKMAIRSAVQIPFDAAIALLQQQKFSGLCSDIHEAAQVLQKHADKALSECYVEFHGVQNIQSTIQIIFKNSVNKYKREHKTKLTL